MADEIPQWAKERAMKLCLDLDPDNYARTVEAWEQNGATSFPAFARYIMEHEEPPVDPLLEEAREICARVFEQDDSFGAKQLAQSVRNGDVDDVGAMKATRDALRRGIELGKAGEA